MLHKIYRKLSDIKKNVASDIRILHLKLKYPDIKITGTTHIAKNCEIVCVDGGEMRLHNAFINYGSQLHCRNKAKLHIESSYIGMNAVIVATDKIIIKNNCEIAEMVVIRDQNHNYNFSDQPISQQGHCKAEITINSNVWIGAKATILKGVTIGKNSVIAAHAVVNKNVDEKTVVGGIPAKILK